MRFFKEVQVAPKCYLIEAVDWIVRGLPPEPWLDDNGNEARGNLKALCNEYVFDQEILSPADLKVFGIALSYEEYLTLLYGEEDKGVHARVEPYPTPLNPDDMAKHMAEWSALRAEEDRLADAKIEAALASYLHEVERAKSLLSAALISGKIGMRGFWAESTDAFDDLCNVAGWGTQPQNIDHRYFSQSAFDWEENTLSTLENPALSRPAGTFYLVTISTLEMLKAFPHPGQDPKQMKVFGGNAVLDDGDASQAFATQPSRGRPRKADWLQEALRAWFIAECAKGVLGRGKQEADIAAAEAWTESMGHRISRTTIQNYLRDLLRKA